MTGTQMDEQANEQTDEQVPAPDQDGHVQDDEATEEDQ